MVEINIEILLLIILSIFIYICHDKHCSWNPEKRQENESTEAGATEY